MQCMLSIQQMKSSYDVETPEVVKCCRRIQFYSFTLFTIHYINTHIHNSMKQDKIMYKNQVHVYTMQIPHSISKHG